jgi:hypothetical protein
MSYFSFSFQPKSFQRLWLTDLFGKPGIRPCGRTPALDKCHQTYTRDVVHHHPCSWTGQVLCNGCREETHRAKMFSAHDIIPVSKYTKDTPKKVSILFITLPFGESWTNP